MGPHLGQSQLSCVAEESSPVVSSLFHFVTKAAALTQVPDLLGGSTQQMKPLNPLVFMSGGVTSHNTAPSFSTRNHLPHPALSNLTSSL